MSHHSTAVLLLLLLPSFSTAFTTVAPRARSGTIISSRSRTSCHVSSSSSSRGVRRISFAGESNRRPRCQSQDSTTQLRVSSQATLTPDEQAIVDAAAAAERTSGTKELLRAEGLSNTFDGERWQFQDITFNICEGQKLGLVGVNGCGKSTLLKALAGIELIDQGKVETPKETSIVYVEQDPVFEPGATVSDVVYGSDTPILRAVKQYQEAAEALGAGEDGAMGRFEKASEKMDAVNGWDMETYAERVMTQLHVLHMQEQQVDSLSGGERKRVALASALMQQPSILILDEPTNHLDFFAIDWLEKLLTADSRSTCLVVSHDRYFLDNVCQEILELDTGKLFRYQGSYEKYLEAKDERIQIEDQQFQVDKEKLKKELEWMRKQPKARQSKSKKREEEYNTLKAKLAKPRAGKEVAVQLGSETKRLGKFILKFKDASLAFDKPILDKFSYEFVKGDRVGIVGPNGVGKTTFLRVLMQQQALDAGTVTPGETLSVGYYDQKGISFEDNRRVREIVEDTCAGVAANNPDIEGSGDPAGMARSLLNKFKFTNSRWNDQYGRLSGGEKRRLQLMVVLAGSPNFLVLDEPSNDLDLQTLEVLEDFLINDYKGCLVVVSHDRWFMSRVTDHMFIFEGEGAIKDYPGTLNEYAFEYEIKNTLKAGGTAKEEEEEEEEEPVEQAKMAVDAPPAEEAAPAATGRPLNNKERMEYKNLERDINKLTKRNADLQQLLLEAYDKAVGFTEQAEWSDEMKRNAEELEGKEERWMELAEIMGDF